MPSVCRPVCVVNRSRHQDSWFCPACDVPYAPPPVGIDPKTWVPIRGGRTFEVKGLLKSYGGRWEPAGKTWWVPLYEMDRALHAVRFLTDLVPDQEGTQDDPIEALCWECGEPLFKQLSGYRRKVERAPYWCGCNEDD